MIKCPKCDGKSTVLHTRPAAGSVNRRRECLTEGCGIRWTTREVLMDESHIIDALARTRKAMRRVEESLVNGGVHLE